jgi:hypothetical protein
MMQKSKLKILSTLIFLTCCAMSKCKNAPGPVTVIHGTVTDAITGQPFGGLQMEVVNLYNNFSESVATNSDGTFYLKFTPQGQGTFRLQPVNPFSNRYYPNTFANIVLGQDNSFDIKTNRQVFIKIHIINNSNQNRSNYALDVTNGRFGSFLELVPPKADTSITVNLPQLSRYTFKSDFFNGFSDAGLADSVNFIKIINIGKADTTVVINNP